MNATLDRNIFGNEVADAPTSVNAARWTIENQSQTSTDSPEPTAQVRVINSSTDTFDAVLQQIAQGPEAGNRFASTSIEEYEVGRSAYRFFLYYWGHDAVIFVEGPDVEESEKTYELELDLEYVKIINQLRKGGREILAEDVVEMLRNSKEDPDEPDIKVFSLRAMARFPRQASKTYRPNNWP